MRLALKLKNLLWFFAALAVMIAFQNCGKGFKSQSTILSSNAPFSSVELSLLSNVPALLNQRSLTVNFLAKFDTRLGLKSLTCQLNSQSLADCRSLSFPMSSLTDGDYTLKINAEDNSGQKAQELVATFRVDATAPVLTMTSKPAAVMGPGVSQFVFSATDNLSGVDITECSIDGSAFSACTSPKDYPGLASISHTVKIRAKDKAGNLSEESPHTWEISNSSPVLTLSVKPPAFTNLTTASFEFSGLNGTQVITSFECKMDSAAYAACTSPKPLTGVPVGSHTFYLRGRDLSGNMSSPITATWMVDTTAPNAPTLASNISGATVSGTLYTKMTTANLTFSATDGGSGVASYSCSLDGAAFAACTSPRNLTTPLAAGPHSLQVRAIDNATNPSALATYSWNIDLTNPTVPGNLSATAVSASQINLSWNASSDAVGIGGYRIYRGGSVVATLTNVLSYQDTGLSGSTTYSYTVEALDMVTNASGQTQAVNATTQAGGGPGCTLAIQSVSGTMTHKGAVTITGCGFGTKTTAAPVIWDDASGSNILDKWDLTWPNTNASYNMAYRNPQRNISLPHNNVTKYLAGAHGGSGANGGGNVMVWKNRNITSYPAYTYASWYQRSDDAWVFGDDDNYKAFDFSRGSGGYDLPYNWYLEYNSRPTSRTSVPAWHILDDAFGQANASLDGPIGNWWFDSAVNPMGGTWSKVELEIKYTNQVDGYVRLWENGVLKVDYDGHTDRYSGTQRSEGIGGFARMANQPNNWRYFSDVYLDYSRARVVLANNSKLANATIIETQIPTSWSNTSVGISVNLGKFQAGQTAYLFVVDPNGTPVTNGFPVTIVTN